MSGINTTVGSPTSFGSFSPDSGLSRLLNQVKVLTARQNYLQGQVDDLNAQNDSLQAQRQAALAMGDMSAVAKIDQLISNNNQKILSLEAEIAEIRREIDELLAAIEAMNKAHIAAQAKENIVEAKATSRKMHAQSTDATRQFDNRKAEASSAASLAQESPFASTLNLGTEALGSTKFAGLDGATVERARDRLAAAAATPDLGLKKP